VLPTGTVSFAAGETSKVITVNVAADHELELNERFAVTLGAPSAGAEIGTATAGAVVFNDDARLSIAETSASKPEGSGAAPTPYTFTVTRSGLLTSAVSAKWSVAGLAGSGTVPSNAADFVGGAFPTGTVSFAAGETSKVITVNVAADRAVELNERFAVTLGAPSAGASFGTASAGAIVFNDDAAGTGTLSIARQWASRSEGQAGATDFTFLVTRSGVTTGTAAADWAVTGGTLAGTVAAAANDFVGGTMAKGSVAFAAGETGKVITVQVAGDVANELNESFTVTLGNQSGGVALGTASAVGVIWNDDAAGTGTLSIARLSTQRGEGQSGATPFTFTVTRSGVLTGTASADWSVTGGGVAGTVAATGADFVGGLLPTGRVSFAAGQASAVVTVAVAGDIAAELNDGFTVTLGGAQAGVSIGTATATGAILNDDFASTAADQALSGTANADVFVLGGGVDTVLGKAGLDVFLYQPAALGDGVTNATFLGDFDPAAGEKLNLSAIDAIVGGGTANDTFTFIGTAAFTAAGQLRWEDQGAVRAIFGSVDADTAPELAIYVSAAGPVTAGWFVL
jgi:hypothetical protein